MPSLKIENDNSLLAMRLVELSTVIPEKNKLYSINENTKLKNEIESLKNERDCLLAIVTDINIKNEKPVYYKNDRKGIFNDDNRGIVNFICNILAIKSLMIDDIVSYVTLKYPETLNYKNVKHNLYEMVRKYNNGRFNYKNGFFELSK